MDTDIKRELIGLCRTYLQQRIDAARQAVAMAQQSANLETKSSSGDKFETGRAMMQIEVEKNTRQLSESLKLQYTLDQIDIEKSSATAKAGSLVVTDHGSFFLAISLGMVEVRGHSYVVLSPGSPLGQHLTGLKVGDSMVFMRQRYLVKELL